MGALRKWRRNPSGLVWRGSGVIFLGNCFMEVPNNFILHRVGACLWIARIMTRWGPHRIALMVRHSLSSQHRLASRITDLSRTTLGSALSPDGKLVTTT